MRSMMARWTHLEMLLRRSKWGTMMSRSRSVGKRSRRTGLLLCPSRHHYRLSNCSKKMSLSKHRNYFRKSHQKWQFHTHRKCSTWTQFLKSKKRRSRVKNKCRCIITWITNLIIISENICSILFLFILLDWKFDVFIYFAKHYEYKWECH